MRTPGAPLVSYLVSQLREILCLFSGEEVDAKEVGGEEEDVSEDEGADDVLFACDDTLGCRVRLLPHDARQELDRDI